jgi:FkbM family methyltransferase
VRFSNSSEEQGAILRDAGGVEVPATTVDDYARTNNLAVDVLKIDTEGNDGLVLLGAAETLRSPSLKLVYFEYAVAPTWFERRGAFANVAST